MHEGRSQCLFRLLLWNLLQQQGSGRIFDKVHRYILPNFGIVHRSVIILGCTCVLVVRLGVTWPACNCVCVCVVVVVSFLVDDVFVTVMIMSLYIYLSVSGLLFSFHRCRC